MVADKIQQKAIKGTIPEPSADGSDQTVTVEVTYADGSKEEATVTISYGEAKDKYCLLYTSRIPCFPI